MSRLTISTTYTFFVNDSVYAVVFHHIMKDGPFYSIRNPAIPRDEDGYHLYQAKTGTLTLNEDSAFNLLVAWLRNI